MLYYTPFDPKDINDKKHAWVERMGDECRANDIPFFLEFVGYEGERGRKRLRLRKEETARRNREHAEFTKDRYGVDVLKVEVPVNMKVCRGRESLRRTKSDREQEARRPLPESRGGGEQTFYLSAQRA